ncbi:N-formylglutamate amidohydrolase [Erythrobacter sp. EC-HK427]|nr:N-formylglutamate amidohydrolase [Erythrobacter sp. EC-HK427]
MALFDQPWGDSPTQSGGRVPGAEGVPAFVLRRPRANPIPVLIAVPHAGRFYPPALTAALRHPREAGLRLEDRYIDLVADRVARATGAGLLLAHAPRAMIDLNRAPDDIDWEMVQGGGSAVRARLTAGRRARSGLGLVPRRLPGLGELWRAPISRAALEERIAWVHQPYHAALAKTLESMRDRWGAALLLDLHSMPPLGPKSGPEAAVDYVIGDRFGAACDSRLVGATLDHFERKGASVAHNRPYAGGYVLDRHGAPARKISAMQLEVCRSAYLDAAMREPAEGVDAVSETIAGLVRLLADEVVAGGFGFAQAAE